MILCPDRIHYYDSEKYSECPYCKRIREGKGAKPTAPAEEEDLKSSKPKVKKRGAHIDRDATAPWYSGEKESEEIFEPVVGWLIAIEGPAKGRDFRLKPGRNVIGRIMEADICIEEDDLLSREHTIVYYYSEINNFYVEDNKSKHGTFLLPNKDVIVERKPIKDGDKILVGKTILLLKTLCNEDFQWKEKT